jgi:hypothetical protein
MHSSNIVMNSRNEEVKTIEKVIAEIFHLLTKNSRSFCHKKTNKTHSFAKRGRARAQERRELATLGVILDSNVTA